jgi:hypothetical protein
LETLRRCDGTNLDLARGELRLSTRKTGKAIVLPLAASLWKQIGCLLTSSNEPSAPVHPKAFDLVERQRKTGNLSNQFAGLLAAAGLGQKKNHKSTGKGRGKRRNVEPSSHCRFTACAGQPQRFCTKPAFPQLWPKLLLATTAKRCTNSR